MMVPITSLQEVADRAPEAGTIFIPRTHGPHIIPVNSMTLLYFAIHIFDQNSDAKVSKQNQSASSSLHFLPMIVVSWGSFASEVCYQFALTNVQSGSQNCRSCDASISH